MIRRRGRPPRGDGPAFDRDAVARLIQDGELIPQPNGPPRHVFPGARELARRYRVSHTLISRFAAEIGSPFQKRRDLARAARPTSTGVPPTRRRGRPRKETPAVDWPRIESILVEGEPVTVNGVIITDYPSYDELAPRFGVSASSISRYAAKHECLARRIEHRQQMLASTPVQLTPDQALDLSAGNLTVFGDPDDNLAAAGTIIAWQYRRDAEQGKVRTNDPTNVGVATKLRLEAHARKRGGADEDSLQAQLVEAARLILEGRRRKAALPAEATGMIIDTTAVELASEPLDAPGDPERVDEHDATPPSSN